MESNFSLCVSIWKQQRKRERRLYMLLVLRCLQEMSQQVQNGIGEHAQVGQVRALEKKESEIRPCSISSSNSISSTETIKLGKNQTLVSPQNIFELGFIQLESHWYLGLWLKLDPKRTCLWAANRDSPLTGAIGTLRLLDSNLVLLDGDDSPVWRTNLTGGGLRSPVMAELLDTGNLILRYVSDPDVYLWESFASPTDTLLPQMKLGIGTERVLSSWARLDDPSWAPILWIEDYMGSYTTVLGQSLQNGYYVSHMHTWNGYRFGNMPPVFKLEEKENAFVMVKNEGHHTRLKMGTDSVYEVFTWNAQDSEWNLTWSSNDACYRSESCESFGYCSMNTSPLCHCINGFSPKLESEWAGCTRNTALGCSKDAFTKLPNMKLPGGSVDIWNLSSNLQQCQESCLVDCNCTAFAVVERRKGQRSCIKWRGELYDMRNYTVGGHDLYVKLFAPKKEGLKPWIIGIIAGGVILLISSCFFWKRIQRGAATQGPTQIEIMMRRIADDDRFCFMDLRTMVEATDNFSQKNELGRGGFGIVYKGVLPDGRVAAVKRLSHMSSQGIEEFKNEVSTILKVLHKNLVRLLGCCCQGEEKILIYEYLPNASLNRFIFDEAQSRLLNWKNRFRIIGEITQGLAYLHNFRESPIIHRDLKPSNILLGETMTSKISDFGMARILQIGQPSTQTDRVMGTIGYMAEEYAMSYIISEKSDVFSLGVMILEIITGRKNYEFCNSNPGDSLLGLAWRQWEQSTGLNLVDPRFEDGSLVEEEVVRCLQVALLCVQDDPEDRPSSDFLVVMLKSRSIELPLPREPHYYYARFLGEQAASSSSLAQGIGSTASSSSLAHGIGSTTVLSDVNDITVSIVQAR
ncbi:unnamed protein product [Microthlaspi erraticum]|uniref:Receptor-like serine/threonine-protein kinase n=1 Tax=Microthlaspi erraticum TaxID=1685480 RepID=A0A6D2J8C8_9BRAS|nr:unnamed protein product [Microthlaspi erraticum]